MIIEEWTLSDSEITVVQMESDFLRVDVAPSVGGRVLSVLHKETGHEFLWRNEGLELEQKQPGEEYDAAFWGGIDELLPNDIPEEIGGKSLPDHGELWTLKLDSEFRQESFVISGQLPICGLRYERTMNLRPNSSHIDFKYRISNPTEDTTPFLWKLHAALRVEEGDVLVCPAYWAEPVDPEWSRWKGQEPFKWPEIEGQRADLVPAPSDEVDFLYLFDLSSGYAGWRSPSKNLEFAYHFDTTEFPYTWIFGSYGGFNGHYTVILEPCTSMPLEVNRAYELGQCSVLGPGEHLSARVSIYAGHSRKG